MNSERKNPIFRQSYFVLRRFGHNLKKIFRLETHQSPLFFHGLLCFLWRVADFVPGNAGVIFRRWIARHRLQKVGKSPYFHAHNTFQDGRQTEIGNRFFSGRYNFFASGPISIGNDVMLGNFIILETSGHAFDDLTKPIREQVIIRKPIVIEDDVWIGDRVVVLGGVTIGRGSVVGAGSVVTKDVLPYSIVVGNPARLIRKRGQDE